MLAGGGEAAGGQGRVTVFGPSDATRVLVLVPGLGGGAGAFSLIGPELVGRVPNLQVWAADRPGDALEDRLGFATGEPGSAYKYYFERLALGSRTFDPNAAQKHPEARSWGLQWALADLRRVVQRARAGGREVFLGGHSIGAATAVTYAAWDFAGRPGHRDLAGLVLVDGGQLGTFGAPNVQEAKKELAKARAAPTPFEDSLGLGAPWVFGVLAQLSAWYASWAPDAPSAIAASPLVPPELRPPGSPTNAGFFAFAAGSVGIQVDRCGPARAAALVGAPEPNTLDWYFPTRLRIDLLGAASLERDPVTRFLGYGSRLRHLRTIDLPIYAFETRDIPDTIAGAKALIAASASPPGRAALVHDRTMRHSTPLCAPWGRSPFLRTLAAWLRKR